MSQRIASLSATPSLFRRATALLAIAVMLTLTVASGSPVVHDCLHADSSHETDHQCAVVLFAAGVTLVPGAAELIRADTTGRSPHVAAFEEVFFVSPRYLRQPERGPPVS